MITSATLAMNKNQSEGGTERRIESLGALDVGLDGSAVVVVVVVVVWVSRGRGAVGMVK